MTPLPLPCRMTPGDLWFSEDTDEQRQAAKLCDGCPLSRYHACREEGWDHEHGVWGGLTPVMRKRMDRKRFDAAVGTAELLSLDIDDTVVDINARIERARLAHAAQEADLELFFEPEGPDIAEMLAIEAV